MKSYSKKILNSLDHDIFKIISDTSDDLKIETYIVGGFVRDLIIDKSVKKDIDIMSQKEIRGMVWQYWASHTSQETDYRAKNKFGLINRPMNDITWGQVFSLTRCIY